MDYGTSGSARRTPPLPGLLSPRPQGNGFQQLARLAFLEHLETDLIAGQSCR